MDVFHEGFQLIRLSSDQPFITLSDKLLTFSKSSIEMLDYSPYVHISINKEKKELLVEACEQDRFSVTFVKEVPKGRQIMVRWANRDLLDPIRELVGVPKNAEPVRIWGEFFPEHRAIKFDLTDIQQNNKSSVEGSSWYIDKP